MMKSDRLSASPPTIHATCEEVIINGIRFRTYDVGGHETMRRIWSDWYCAVDAVVFMVDAADRTRFEEAREQMARILADKALLAKPIAVLGNKIDIPCAASREELCQQLGLAAHVDGAKCPRPVELF